MSFLAKASAGHRQTQDIDPNKQKVLDEEEEKKVDRLLSRSGGLDQAAITSFSCENYVNNRDFTEKLYLEFPDHQSASAEVR